MWQPQAAERRVNYESDDDGDDSDEFKEGTSVEGPDEDGVKTYDIYKIKDDGKRVHIKRKTKLVTKTIVVNKNVARRRKLAKFGECKNKGTGPEEGFTALASSFPFILRPRSKDDAEKDEEKAKMDKLKAAKEGVATCRLCGESSHFTLKCPKRDLIEVDMPIGDPSTGGGRGGVREGRYVPPRLRGGAGGTRGLGIGGGDRAYDEYKVRITNISQDAQEIDIRELFREFGNITRVYVAKDRITNLCRGFAFVSFVTKSSADAAVEVMNGHGYDNLILRVEHAKPREEDQQRPASNPAAAYAAFNRRREAQST